ncbi:MAG: hypothetical protein AABY55_00960 [Candidatus Omnitrophota bacterium]
MHKKKIKKGFAFKPDINYIKETMDMPAKAKLEWLEEVNNFVYKTLPKRKIEIWEKIKKGEA